jgi:FtsH-binding integral membrane protein
MSRQGPARAGARKGDNDAVGEVKTTEPHTSQITISERDSDQGGNVMSAHRLLQIALAVFGAAFLLIYPLAIVWPSGWAWHAGAPYESQYFMMIVGVYATLGVFLLNASRNPQAHRSLIWFTVWSSVVHGGIMAVQSMPAEHCGHLLGDVPALFLFAIVLGGLLVWSEKEQARPLGLSVAL